MSAHKGSIPWNKGTGKGWVDKRGYRWVYVTEYGKRRAKRESRVIMEKHLERILEPWELVHHKDGKPDNNSIDNLEVLEWDEHTIMHHSNKTRPDQTKKSIQAHALMREEIKRLRGRNSELLEALAWICNDAEWEAPEQEGSNGWYIVDADAIEEARQAIEKAKGGG